MFDRGCRSTSRLCPVTSTDQWKNCAREAHRDSVTSTHILQMLLSFVFHNKERQYFNQNKQWNNFAYITKDGVKLR